MGHAINYCTYSAETDTMKIYDELNDMVEHECWQEGGSLEPIRFIKNVILEDYDKAVEYIEKNDRGWYDCLAVKYKSYKKIESAKLKKLEIRSKEAYDKWINEDNKIYMQNIKSMYPSCRHCNSKMLRKHLLKSNYCPVCGMDLRSETILNKLQNLKTKYSETSNAYNTEVKNLQNKSNNYELKWLVKIEYHV